MNKEYDVLFNAIDNDIDTFDGVIGNCRWRYDSTNNPMACGVLSLASNSNFDRWANSRIIEINTVLWDENDPPFRNFIKSIINKFD